MPDLNDHNEKASSIEYVLLVAFLISIGALGTDLMLPALNVIGVMLNVSHENDVHFIVTTFFLGMAIGQLIVGPLSDSFGRKPIILIGYFVFIVGCLLSMFAPSWAMMLVGRTLQGLGAAAPRIIIVAMVRDEFEGRAMARIMSLVMAVFILVPIIAPALGQGLIYMSGWKATFVCLIVLAAIASLWFHWRQTETLSLSNRRRFHIGNILKGFKEAATTPVVMGYTVATGFMYGMFLGYLGSAQQIFQVTLGVGDLFVLYFAIASVSFGVSSLVNAHLVMRLGMRKLTWFALVCLTAISFIFWLMLLRYDGVPPASLFLIWQISTFFFVGIMFGNLNTLAMEPLGHMAGLGAAFVGSVATFISLPLAWLIGRYFDGTVYPLLAGFSLLGFCTCVAMAWTDKKMAHFHRAT